MGSIFIQCQYPSPAVRDLQGHLHPKPQRTFKYGKRTTVRRRIQIQDKMQICCSYGDL